MFRRPDVRFEFGLVTDGNIVACTLLGIVHACHRAQVGAETSWKDPKIRYIRFYIKKIIPEFNTVGELVFKVISKPCSEIFPVYPGSPTKRVFVIRPFGFGNADPSTGTP